MRLEFHRQIALDISRIMTYYEGVAGLKLADEFYSELRLFFQKAANSPEAYGIVERDLRRVNLERFPYHFLFRVVEDRVRVLDRLSSSAATVARSASPLNLMTPF